MQPEELVDILVGLKTGIEATVYIQRNRAPETLKELKETGIVIIDVIGDLLLHRSSQDKELVASLRELHIDPELALRILRSVFNHQESPSQILAKKKRLKPRRKRALKKKK